MTGWILKAILFLIVVRLIWRFLSGLIDGLTPDARRSGGGGAAAGSQGKAASVPLVRDPVCGKFVVPSRAIAAGRGDQIQYFCSEKCRDEYARRA